MKRSLAENPVLKIYKRDAHRLSYIQTLAKMVMEQFYCKNLYMTMHCILFITEAERKYSSYELEVLVIIEALKKFRVYLLGVPFKIVTDFSAFQKTTDKKDLTIRWLLLLEKFDYIIEDRIGTRMRHVDALSQYSINQITCEYTCKTKIKKAQENYEETKAIKEILKEKPYEDYFIQDDLLCKYSDGFESLEIPRAMQTEIIKKIHEEGHLTAIKIEEKLKPPLYTPKLKSKIDKVIYNCVPCIMCNRKGGKQEGFLHPL